MAATAKFEQFTGSSTIVVTIANGASLSSVAQLGGSRLLAILVGAWTSAAISFQVSVDNSNFFDLYDATGTEVSIPAGTHNKAYAAPLELLGFPYIKIRSGLTGAGVNQSGGDDVTLVLVD